MLRRIFAAPDNYQMRFFCSLVLVGSGCGVGDGRPVDELPSIDFDMEVGTAPPTPLIADLCAQKSWDITPDTKQLDLSVVKTAAGASVLTVPTDGGAVRGFRVDQRGDLFDRDIAPIREDRNYTSVSASTANGRLIVASHVDDKIALDIVRDDLGERHDLGDVSGTLITEAPMASSRGAQVSLVGSESGLIGHAFTGATWQAGSPTDVTKASIVSMSATPYNDDVMFAWSTSAKTCHVSRFASGQESQVDFGCDDVRIASHDAHHRGMMVYVEDGVLYRSDLFVGVHSALYDNEVINKIQLRESASSPRIVFDGERFWISYLEVHGNVVVGFVDGQGKFHSRALATHAEVPEAYDLAVFGEGVWVVGIGDASFEASRVCAR